VTEAGVSGRAISCRINDGQPMQIGGAVPILGTGVAFAANVVRLLRSLPGRGALASTLHPGGKYDGRKVVAGRVGDGACENSDDVKMAMPSQT
jgi:hypothetical protein